MTAMSCGCSTGTGHLVGSSPTLTFEFTTRAGAPADPTTIDLAVLSPGGTTTTYDKTDMTSTTVGTWVFDFPAPLTEPGEWWVYVVGAGGGAAGAAERSFALQDTRVPLAP